MSMIKKHPIQDCKHGREATFTFDGKERKSFEGAQWQSGDHTSVRNAPASLTEPSKDRAYVVSVVILKDKIDEIREWIARGYDTFDELKRELRVGMGPCQGRGCRDIILREISKATGKPVAEIAPGTMRPPVKPIKIKLLA